MHRDSKNVKQQVTVNVSEERRAKNNTYNCPK